MTYDRENLRPLAKESYLKLKELEGSSVDPENLQSPK